MLSSFDYLMGKGNSTLENVACSSEEMHTAGGREEIVAAAAAMKQIVRGNEVREDMIHKILGRRRQRLSKEQ